MTTRLTASRINDDQLDALYDELERLRVAAGGPPMALSAPQAAQEGAGREARREPSGARTELHALLARLITDAAHHTRCAERCRELGRTDEGAAIHDGFAAGFCEAAVYTAELIASGKLQWRGGHQVPDADEAAAAHVVGALAGTPQERARQILCAIRGEAA